MNRPLTPLALIGLCGAGLRLLAVPPLLPDLDAANFAAALAAFDPLHQAPHWPGYPVYVAFAKLFAALGFAERHALALPGVVGFVLALPLFFLGVERRFGRSTGLVLAAVAAVLPGAVVAAGAPQTEGLGFALLLAAIGASLLAAEADAGSATARGFARRPSGDGLGPWAAALGFARRPQRWALLAGLLAGLGLGVRLSWWPLFLGAALVAARRRPLAAGAAFVAGVAAWGTGLVLVVGAAAPQAIAQFAEGHFFVWGGAVSSGAPSELAPRAAALVRATAAGVGGLLVAAVAALALLVRRATAAVASRFDSAAPARASAPARAWALTDLQLALASAAAYAVWVFLAQNAARPRHALPLALVLAAAFAVVVHRRYGRRAVVAVCAVLGAFAFVGARGQGSVPSPHAQAAMAIAARAEQAPVQVFAGRHGRLVERLVPGVRLWRPADERVLVRAADDAYARGAEVLILSGTPGVDLLNTEIVEIFSGPRSLFGPDAEVTLYRYTEVRSVASR